ncbi:MAG: hypothetical protein ACRD10_13395, partial [Terriglobia bacterium]
AGANAVGGGRASGRGRYGGSASRGSGAGGGYGAGSGNGGAASGQQLAPGGNFPSAPKNGNLVVNIVGEYEAGQWLAQTLNTVIQHGGAQLEASSVSMIPNPKS